MPIVPSTLAARRDFRFFDSSLDEFLLSLLSSQQIPLSPTPKKPSELRTKYELGSYIKQHGLHHKVRTCGLRWQCGNEFLCPFCTPKRLKADRSSIEGLLRVAPSAEFVTLTVHHDADHTLADLWDAITSAWALMTKGKRWDKFRARFGVSGNVRAFDATWSPERGWHPHWHVAFVFEKELSEHKLAGFRAELTERWVAALNAVGHTGQAAAQRSEAIRNPAAVAAYLTGNSPFKLSETALPSYTPGDFLHSATQGDLTAAELWSKYEAASHHRRALAGAGVFRTMPRIAERRVVQFE